MKNPQLRLVFDRKNKADDFRKKDRKQKGLLQVELYFAGKRKWYTTGISLYKGQWDDVKMVINHPESVDLNTRLSTILARANKNITAQIEKGEFSTSDFDKIFTMEQVDETSLVDCAMEVSELYKQMGKSRSAYMQYSALHAKLEEYNADKNVTYKIRKIDDATLDAIESFDIWMRSIANLGDSTAWLYHCKLRHTIRYYVKKHHLRGFENPYLDFELEKPNSNTIKYLSEDEIAKIEKLEIKERNRQFVRDLFMFQRYTGLSFGDAMILRKELDVEKLADGRYALRKERIKSGVNFAIILLPSAMEILDRYGGRLDKYCLQNVNMLLHEIGLAAIGRKITTHIARHTFATYALNHGVSLEYVSKMLGHTNIMTTQRYAKVLAQNVLDQFKKLE